MACSFNSANCCQLLLLNDISLNKSQPLPPPLKNFDHLENISTPPGKNNPLEKTLSL